MVMRELKKVVTVWECGGDFGGGGSDGVVVIKNSEGFGVWLLYRCGGESSSVLGGVGDSDSVAVDDGGGDSISVGGFLAGKVMVRDAKMVVVVVIIIFMLVVSCQG